VKDRLLVRQSKRRLLRDPCVHFSRLGRLVTTRDNNFCLSFSLSLSLSQFLRASYRQKDDNNQQNDLGEHRRR
jgi:hypothetical protein